MTADNATLVNALLAAERAHWNQPSNFLALKVDGLEAEVVRRGIALKPWPQRLTSSHPYA